jgi:lysophospholipase L1-like esterase
MNAKMLGNDDLAPQSSQKVGLPNTCRRRCFLRRLTGRVLCGGLVLAVLVSACSGDRFDKIQNIRAPGETIICFGDSLTEGVGAGEGEDYPSLLSRELVLPIVNAGQRGDTTALALERIDSVLNKNPRLVIILLGGNDFLRQVPRAETRRNLEAIVRRIQANGAMAAIAGIRLGLFTDEYAMIFEETAERFGALYIPAVMKGILSDSKLRSDPIHPNGAGYRLIAGRIGEKIRPLLREADRLRAARPAGDPAYSQADKHHADPGRHAAYNFWFGGAESPAQISAAEIAEELEDFQA